MKSKYITKKLLLSVGLTAGFTCTVHAQTTGSTNAAASLPQPHPDAVTASNTKNYPFPANYPLRKTFAAPDSTQPKGPLSGRLIYTVGGHGMSYRDTPKGKRWGFDRPNLNNMIEDLGNHDQMTFFADAVFRAGGTVVPVRPVGNQTNEVIVDDNNQGFSLFGNWSNNTDSHAVYYGKNEDPIRYRYTKSSPTETAVARFTPTIPAPGYYPVYTWVRFGEDLADNQLYKITHSGGETDVHVNHRRVGKGWVYLGTYYFESGTQGYVEVSNLSDSQGLIIADAIRFGNGIGDIEREGTKSGRPREDEAGRYWVQKSMQNDANHVASVYDRPASDDPTDNVGVPPRTASFMNNEKDGRYTDRVYVSMHTNAKGNISEYDRGADGLWNNDSLTTIAKGTKTPNQERLAYLLGLAVNDDLAAISSKMEHPWINNRKRHELFRNDFAFGEIRWDAINHEMDATLLEVAYHDHVQDSALMLSPKVRQWVARSMVRGLVQYFEEFGKGGPLVYTPDAPVAIVAANAGGGNAQITWQPAKSTPSEGGQADEYLVYRSTNGYGFGNPVRVPAGQQSVRIPAPLNQISYFRVTAVNQGGESLPSEVAAICPGNAQANVLIVNGFDRLDRKLNPIEEHDGKPFQRVKPWRSNNHDYVVQHAKALQAAGKTFDSSSNDFISEQAVKNYSCLVWILGNESTADKTFDENEQKIVSQYLMSGKSLFVSGADIGFDLESTDSGKNFFRSVLGASLENTSAETHGFSAAPSGIFTGLTEGKFGEPAPFDNSVYPPVNFSPYRVDSADVLKPSNPATDKIVLTYQGGAYDKRGAAIARDNQNYKTIVLGFPFESITTDAERVAIMVKSMEFLQPKK